MQDLKVLGDRLVASSAVATVQSPEGIPDTSTGAQQPAAESSKDADKNQGEVDATDIKDGSDATEKKSVSSGSYDGRTNFSGSPEKCESVRKGSSSQLPCRSSLQKAPCTQRRSCGRLRSSCRLLR